MSRVTISIEHPSAQDLGLLHSLLQQIGVPDTAAVTGGYDSITVTADLDTIRQRESDRINTMLSFGLWP